MLARALLALACLSGVATLPARATPALCEEAALRAAAESGVPADVLLAIALTETGRSLNGRMRPWPWAANADGRGHWFDTREQAAAFARDRLAAGRPSFDLGCFQINWRWHGQHFSAPEALLDPLTAARYAARFLSALHAETGDWTLAAGAYHSRTPQLARRYRARFMRLRAMVTPGADMPLAETHTAPSPPAAQDAHPIRQSPAGPPTVRIALLAPGGTGRGGGSLVPRATAAPFLPATPGQAQAPTPAPPRLLGPAAGILAAPPGPFLPVLVPPPAADDGARR